MPDTGLTEFRPSVCPLDCPDTCSLSVATDGERVLEVRGSDDNPYTAGVLCSKVMRSYPEFVHGDNRLTRPLKRTGPRGSGQFAPISWDEAIDLIHDGFQAAIARHGPQSVLPLNYGGPHGELAAGSMDRRFFHKVGASLLNRGPLCGIVRGSAYASLFGGAPGMLPERAAESDLVVVWGSNTTVSYLHLVRAIKAARKRGAKLVVVDPKRIKIAEQADLFLQVRPGSDLILAQALAAELERRGAFNDAFIAEWVTGFDAYMAEARKVTPEQAIEASGIDADQFAQLATWYAQAERVGLSVGNGMERGRSGGSAIRSVMALQALTGNLGRRGAGVIAKQGLAVPRTTDKLQRPDLVPEGTRTLNIVDLGALMLDDTLDPPIAATLIYNHNPVATHPDQNRLRKAFLRADLFIAGLDIAMTDSMKYCDVVLPATSHFETADLYGSYGQSYLQRAEAVIPPVGEALPNTEVFRRLAARFGFDDPIFTASDAELMDDAMQLDGVKPSELPLASSLLMTAPDGEDKLICNNVAPGTPSGKVELYSPWLEERFGYGLPRFEPVARDPAWPLTLMSPSPSKRTNATFGGCSESQGIKIVEIHPDDAAARGIETDDVLREWNDLGETRLKAVISEAMQPGVLYTPKGTWLATSATGQTVNALINIEVRTDIEDGACYNETFVEVAKTG